MFTWDNYTRELVKGWSRLGMSACEISLAWPWDKAPTGQDVLKLQLELLVYVNHQRASESQEAGPLPPLRRGSDTGEAGQAAIGSAASEVLRDDPSGVFPLARIPPL